MAKKGMGAVYELTSHLALLRRKLSMVERDSLMRDWYFPHHQQLEEVASAAN